MGKNKPIQKRCAHCNILTTKVRTVYGIGWLCIKKCYPFYAKIKILEYRDKIKKLKSGISNDIRKYESFIDMKIHNLKQDGTWTKVFMEIERR